MKRKSIAGLIAVAAIVMFVVFSGCTELETVQEDIPTNGEISVWLTDVIRTNDEIKIIIHVKNEGAHEQKIVAIRTTMFGAESGIQTTIVRKSGVNNVPELIALGPGDSTSFELHCPKYNLIPYANKAEIRFFFDWNDYDQTFELRTAKNTFVFVWSEDDIQYTGYR